MDSVLEAVRKIKELMRNMPTRARWHALISVGIAFVFYGLIVYPALAKLENLKKESAALQEQIELQARSLPLYMRLATVNKLHVLETLSQTRDASMSKGEVQNIASKLAVLARENRIVVLSAIPQPNLKSGVANLVPVDIIIKGHFLDFRGFLTGVSALQGFRGISHLEITKDADRERLEARLWVVVE